MIKVYCNACDQQITDRDFQFEGAKQELITDLKTGNRSLQKDVIHICKKCFDLTFKPLLYGKGKNDNKKETTTN